MKAINFVCCCLLLLIITACVINQYCSLSTIFVDIPQFLLLRLSLLATRCLMKRWSPDPRTGDDVSRHPNRHRFFRMIWAMNNNRKQLHIFLILTFFFVLVVLDLFLEFSLTRTHAPDGWITWGTLGCPGIQRLSVSVGEFRDTWIYGQGEMVVPVSLKRQIRRVKN